VQTGIRLVLQRSVDAWQVQRVVRDATFCLEPFWFPLVIWSGGRRQGAGERHWRFWWV